MTLPGRVAEGSEGSPSDELARLYREASTPAEAARLLSARGRPNMAMLISTLGSSPARGTAALFREWSEALIVGDGWYEPGRERALQPPEAKRKILAAFKWLADVFDRYASKQLPIPPYQDPESSRETVVKQRKRRKNYAQVNRSKGRWSR